LICSRIADGRLRPVRAEGNHGRVDWAASGLLRTLYPFPTRRKGNHDPDPDQRATSEFNRIAVINNVKLFSSLRNGVPAAAYPKRDIHKAYQHRHFH